MAGFLCPLLFIAAAGIGSANLAKTANAQGVGPVADRSRRELLVAHDTMRNERIDTVDRGQVQLLFADQSSLSIAPGSDVVINEFLYDPQTQTGNLTATLTAGLLRYVGGEISKKTNVAFSTPTATVSVRDGIILIKTERDTRPGGGGGKTEALFLSGGRMCVIANGQSQCTTKFATAITSEKGEPPSAPAPVTPATIQALLSKFQVTDPGTPTEAPAEAGNQATPAAAPVSTDQGLTKPR